MKKAVVELQNSDKSKNEPLIHKDLRKNLSNMR